MQMTYFSMLLTHTSIHTPIQPSINPSPKLFCISCCVVDACAVKVLHQWTSIYWNKGHPSVKATATVLTLCCKI